MWNHKQKNCEKELKATRISAVMSDHTMLSVSQNLVSCCITLQWVAWLM